jgi:hypothetical protein
LVRGVSVRWVRGLKEIVMKDGLALQFVSGLFIGICSLEVRRGSGGVQQLFVGKFDPWGANAAHTKQA